MQKLSDYLGCCVFGSVNSASPSIGPIYVLITGIHPAGIHSHTHTHTHTHWLLLY